MQINVSIYEDNPALRESLIELIKADDNIVFCGAYPNCLRIIENCKLQKPDVILMDIDMPGISGIEATKLVKQVFPEINVMMLTVYEDKEKIFNALCAGATGYLLKKSSSTKIIESIKELMEGSSPISGEIARKVFEYFSNQNATKRNDYALSNRETEILNCLVKGDSYKMIASSCFISIGTVRSHINSIYKKLEINSKSEAVAKAINEKLSGFN